MGTDNTDLKNADKLGQANAPKKTDGQKSMGQLCNDLGTKDFVSGSDESVPCMFKG